MKLTVWPTTEKIQEIQLPQERFVLPQIFGSEISQGDDLLFTVGSLIADMSMCRRTVLYLRQYVPETA